MFNITNPEEVLALSHKPIVEELGILLSIFGPIVLIKSILFQYNTLNVMLRNFMLIIYIKV
jgi:hypothetical protein